jgi:antitoxin (DNA-binding transcriptional repressor) of toxin-antitoxin stability system
MGSQIVKTGETITVAKRGQSVVTLEPVLKKRKSSRGILKGKLHIPDEVLMADMSDL